VFKTHRPFDPSGVGNVSVDSSRYTKGSIGSVCARSSSSRRAPGPKADTFRSILLISAPLEIRRRLGRITRGCRHQCQIGGAYGSVVPFPPRGVRATTLLSVLKVRHGSLESPRRKTHRVASKGQERRWRSKKNLALPYDPVKPDASFQRSRSRHYRGTKSAQDLRSTRRYHCTTFTMPIQES
jgi:hypothetical protein